jgi:hypothetical protein
VGEVVLVAAVVLTVWSGIDYVVKATRTPRTVAS